MKMLRDQKLKTSSERLKEFAARIEQTETFDMEGAKFDVSEHVFSMIGRQWDDKEFLKQHSLDGWVKVERTLRGCCKETLTSLWNL